jgi:uncharacterized membrane protein
MTTPHRLPPSVRARRAADERAIGRLLISVTYVAVTVLVVGVAAMLVAGVSPLDEPPSLDASSFWAALTSLRPDAILWIGLALVIATPIVRVAAAAVTYVRSGERRMVAISVAILVVIAIGLVTAQLTETALG